MFQGCPFGWVEQFGQCYLFSTEEKTWKEADMHCRSNGVTGRGEQTVTAPRSSKK